MLLLPGKYANMSKVKSYYIAIEKLSYFFEGAIHIVAKEKQLNENIPNEIILELLDRKLIQELKINI